MVATIFNMEGEFPRSQRPWAGPEIRLSANLAVGNCFSMIPGSRVRNRNDMQNGTAGIDTSAILAAREFRVLSNHAVGNCFSMIRGNRKCGRNDFQYGR